MIGWALFVACTGGSTEDTADSTPVTTGPVYPDGERVLLYTGHSGEDGNNNGSGKFDNASDWIKSTYGWNVSDRTDLADPLQYRVMILVDSGVKGESVFGESSVDLVVEALDAGVRVVSVVSPDNCGTTTLNGLFESLGAVARYTGTGASTAKVAVVEPARSHQLTEDVAEARFLEACWVESNGATVVFSDDRDVVMTVEPVGHGELVVIGDFSWFDDRGYLDDSDNLALLGNLVEIDPGLGPLVDSGSD
jgi:hypothetical protein